MNNFGDSTGFSGVSATPNVFTRLYDRGVDLVLWLTSWTYAGSAGTWSAQTPSLEADAPRPNELYFH